MLPLGCLPLWGREGVTLIVTAEITHVSGKKNFCKGIKKWPFYPLVPETFYYTIFLSLFLIFLVIEMEFSQKKMDYAGVPHPSNRFFHTRAARSAPMIGATMKSQSWDNASPPTMRAGPRLRAGLTDVPVIMIPTR